MLLVIRFIMTCCNCTRISHDLGTIPIVLLTGDPVGSCRKPVSTGGQYYRALLVRDPAPNLSVKNVRVAVLRASD
jgi:hypothetical protein